MAGPDLCGEFTGVVCVECRHCVGLYVRDLDLPDLGRYGHTAGHLVDYYLTTQAETVKYRLAV